jgi:Flp pilus assembly pilin Flp
MDGVRRFGTARQGVTSIEYAMISGIVSIAILVAVQATGANLNAKFFGPLLAGFR